VQYVNNGGVKLSMPSISLPKKTVEVTLQSGQTVGELVCAYTGEYTEENLALTQRMNRGKLEDLDFVQPGTKIRLIDNRKPKLATAEAEWWKNKENGGSVETTTKKKKKGDAEAEAAAAKKKKDDADDAGDGESEGARADGDAKDAKEGEKGGKPAKVFKHKKPKKEEPPKLKVKKDGVDMLGEGR
jgi:hypothetical protein